MSKFVFTCLLLFLALTLSTSVTEAGPLRLEYEVTNLGGGSYGYDFDLILDNNDGSWSAGQAWRWFIFGDDATASPLTGYTMSPGEFPVGPWISLGATSGGHNGPSFNSVLSYWTPTGIGDKLSWSGTATADLAQGSLLYTTLAGTLNGGVPENFSVASRVDPATVPEPSTLLLLAVGGFGLALYSRRRRRA